MENLFTADNKWIKHQIQQLLWHFHIVKQNLLNEELENSEKDNQLSNLNITQYLQMQK